MCTIPPTHSTTGCLLAEVNLNPREGGGGERAWERGWRVRLRLSTATRRGWVRCKSWPLAFVSTAEMITFQAERLNLKSRSVKDYCHVKDEYCELILIKQQNFLKIFSGTNFKRIPLRFSNVSDPSPSPNGTGVSLRFCSLKN